VAEPPAAKPRRRTSVALWASAGVVAAIAVVLAVVVGISAIVGDRPAASLKHVAVAKVNGDLVVYGCEDAGIGTVELQRGSSVDGVLVWSAEKTAGGNALKALPVKADVPGYSVRELGPLDQQLALRRITDSRGVNLLRSYLVFRPAALAEGSVAMQNGKTQTLSSWLAATPGC
jgi:hypothetical protein